jgi:hypothetical protein
MVSYCTLYSIVAGLDVALLGFKQWKRRRFGA